MITTVTTKPFREAHADFFKCAPEYADQFSLWLPALVELGKIDHAGSHILDERILYVSGWNEAAPGVAELFLFPSIHVQKNKRSFYEHARWWVQYLKDDYRRLQCWGEDTELSKRWLSALGFKHEGTLDKFTADGRNMTIWGLT